MTKIDVLCSKHDLFIVQKETIFVGERIPSEDYYLNSDDSIHELLKYSITGYPSDCQLLVALNEDDVIYKALGNVNSSDLAHWSLLEYEQINEGEFTERPFSVDAIHDYVIVHGDNRDLYVPRRHGTIYDIENNECSSLEELVQTEIVSFSSSFDEWMFISDEQDELNVQKIENIVNNCCAELNKSGIMAHSINDLIQLYIKNKK